MDTSSMKAVSMISSATADHNNILHWVEDLERVAGVRTVLESRAFKRLEHVSFLGALDYIAVNSKARKTPRTRAWHSKHVAALANYVATKRNYDKDLKRHLIIAGLLHDIGHIPLSHSVEPYVKRSLGIGHHEIGEAIINGDSALGDQLSKALANMVDQKFLIQLLNGYASQTVGGDLFSSPINIDTIDGITRTYGYLAKPTHNHNINVLNVASASFLDNDENPKKVLDQFWKTKHFVYANLINSRLGLLADNYSQYYFEKNETKVTELELYEDELDWKKKYTVMFNELSQIDHKSTLPTGFVGKSIEFQAREYLVDATQPGLKRYISKKEKQICKLSDFPMDKTAQALLV